jgi:hypothetical protein
MALVPCGEFTKIGRDRVPVLRDTDDLDDLSYYYYRKAEKRRKTATKLKIINGILTGEEIEANPEKYEELMK